MRVDQVDDRPHGVQQHGPAGWRHVFKDLPLTGERLLPDVCPEAVIIRQDAVQQLSKAIMIDRAAALALGHRT